MLDISDSEDEDVMKKFLYFLDQYINEFKEIQKNSNSKEVSISLNKIIPIYEKILQFDQKNI